MGVGEVLDRVIGLVSPRAELARVRTRAATQMLRRGYDGARNGRRSDGWFAPGTSADAEIAVSADSLRRRQRDLVRNSPHSAKAVSEHVSHIVGTGIMPRAATGDEERNKRLNDLFAEAVKTWDADGLDFYGQQTLACRMMVTDGEALARRRLRRKSFGLKVPLQVQMIEADLLDASKTMRLDTGFVKQGVEYDRDDRRVGYWLFPFHPGDSLGFGSLVSNRVPARDIAHLFERQRTQVRGVPWGAPAITTVRDHDDGEVAELTRKKMESCLVGVLVGGDEGEAIGLPLGGEGGQPSPGVYNGSGAMVEQFEPGMFVHARGGRDIKFTQPASTASHAAFKRDTLHTAAAGWRLPYELMTGDHGQTSFSGGRLSQQGYRRFISTVQWQIFIPLHCQPMWDWFVEAAYLAGLYDEPTARVEWAPPPFEALDPLKDAMAIILEVRAGLRSLPEAVAATGRDFRTVLMEIKAAVDLIDELGLVLDSDPRHTDKSGAFQAALAAAFANLPEK